MAWAVAAKLAFVNALRSITTSAICVTSGVCDTTTSRGYAPEVQHQRFGQNPALAGGWLGLISATHMSARQTQTALNGSGTPMGPANGADIRFARYGADA
jgi:hypothetical protein